MECCQMLGDGQGPERVGVCLGFRHVWADALLFYLKGLAHKIHSSCFLKILQSVFTNKSIE